jgi:hypothetical protein
MFTTRITWVSRDCQLECLFLRVHAFLMLVASAEQAERCDGDAGIVSRCVRHVAAPKDELYAVLP